jgi:hypothetical protein
MNSETLKKLYAMAYKKAKQDVEHSAYENVLSCISNIANDYTTFKSLYDKVNDMRYIIDTSIKALPEQVYQVLTWSNITDKPAQFPPAPHSHKWSNITGKPTAYNPTQHSIIDYHTVPADSDKEVPITSNGMVQLRRLRIDDIKELDNRLTSIQENVGKGYVSIRSGSGGGTPLTVEEEDGAPSVSNVKTIIVSDGTLTDDGSGQVTIDTGGGIDSGTSFPGSPSTGDVFYRTDLMEMAFYDGTRWVGNEITISVSPYNTFAYNMSLGNSIPFFTAIAENLKITKASIGLWSGGHTWDASNYWTVLFRLRNAASSDNALDSFTVQTRPDWDVFDFDIVDTIINATDQMMYVSLVPTGSPSNISAGFYFTARKIFT